MVNISGYNDWFRAVCMSQRKGNTWYCHRMICSICRWGFLSLLFPIVVFICLLWLSFTWRNDNYQFTPMIKSVAVNVFIWLSYCCNKNLMRVIQLPLIWLFT